MAAVHNFRPDLALVNVGDNTRSQIFTGAVQETNHFIVLLVMDCMYKLHEIWVAFKAK